MNFLEQKDGRYYANGMEVSKRVYIAAQNQNDRHIDVAASLLDGRRIRPWNRIKMREHIEAMRSKKAATGGYNYTVGIGEAKRVAMCNLNIQYQELRPGERLLHSYFEYNCPICCDLGRVMVQGKPQPCPGYNCEARNNLNRI